MKNDPNIKKLLQSQNKQPTSSGCFIATAAFGTPHHPFVEELQQFRDKVLVKNYYGTIFVNYYNKCSPILARFVRKYYILKWLTVIFILLPSLFIIRLFYKLNR